MVDNLIKTAWCIARRSGEISLVWFLENPFLESGDFQGSKSGKEYAVARSFWYLLTNHSEFFLWIFLKLNIPARFFTGKIRLVQTATFSHRDKKSMFWQRSDDKLQQLSLTLVTKKNWQLKFKISALEFSENNFYSDLSIRGKTSPKFVTKKTLKAELEQKHFNFRKTFYPIPGIAIVPHSKVKVLS